MFTGPNNQILLYIFTPIKNRYQINTTYVNSRPLILMVTETGLKIEPFNPNSIGVKYSLIILGEGFLHHVSVLTSLLVKEKYILN